MSVGATTQAALEEQILRWRVLCYADFQGDVLRATNAAYDKVIAGSGDAELDGTFEAYGNNIVEISPVTHNESGSDAVIISMGGLVVNNAGFLNLIGDQTKWQGRPCRLWLYMVDENEAQVGDITPYYTGYMNDVTISGNPEQQSVSLTVENYLVTLAGTSNKTYAMQAEFDSGDNSAAATIAAANGLGGGGSSGYGGSGGGTSPRRPRGTEYEEY